VLGLTRVTWLNLHRLPALVVAAGLGLHVALSWGPFVARLRRARARRGLSEPLLYVAFWTVALTGTGLWLIVGGSTPLQGPVQLGPLEHGRHHVVDVHHIAGLVALPLTVHHVGHRWRLMTRALRARTVGPGRACGFAKRTSRLVGADVSAQRIATLSA
jgi:hypothetical protein